MDMNKYLEGNKDKWMTPDLLKAIATDPEMAVLFSKPEYLNAI